MDKKKHPPEGEVRAGEGGTYYDYDYSMGGGGSQELSDRDIDFLFSGNGREGGAAAGFNPFNPFNPVCGSEIPRFPVRCMGRAERYIKSVAASYQVDPGMVGGCVIGTLGTCNQGKYVVHAFGDWFEPVSIFHLTAADSGENKTQTQHETVESPITEYERTNNQQFAPMVLEWESEKEIIEGQIKSEMDRLKKGKGDRDKLKDLQSQLLEHERDKVSPVRLLTCDSTPQALEKIMAAYGGSMTICTDEAASMFEVIAGKYSNEAADTGVYCKGYSGSRIITDRIGRETVTIEHPALSINAMIQPGLLAKYMGNEVFRTSGLMARFLYSFPPSMLEYQQPDSPPIDRALRDGYRQAVNGMLVTTMEEPAVLELTAEAKELFSQYYIEIRDRMVDGDLTAIKDYGNKVRGNALRIAGNLHCLRYAYSIQDDGIFDSGRYHDIDADTMRDAIELSRYYVACAIHAYNGGPTEAERDALYIWDRLIKAGTDSISKGRLHNACKKFRTADEMKPGLDLLTERGYIAVTTAQTKGRPSITITINPAAKVEK